MFMIGFVRMKNTLKRKTSSFYCDREEKFVIFWFQLICNNCILWCVRFTLVYELSKMVLNLLNLTRIKYFLN